MTELNWRGEVPYHELRGTYVFPSLKFLTLSEAKAAAQRQHDLRTKGDRHD